MCVAPQHGSPRGHHQNSKITFPPVLPVLAKSVSHFGFHFPVMSKSRRDREGTPEVMVRQFPFAALWCQLLPTYNNSDLASWGHFLLDVKEFFFAPKAAENQILHMVYRACSTSPPLSTPLVKCTSKNYDT